MRARPQYCFLIQNDSKAICATLKSAGALRLQQLRIEARSYLGLEAGRPVRWSNDALDEKPYNLENAGL